MRSYVARLAIVLVAVGIGLAVSPHPSHAATPPLVEPIVWQLNRDYPDGTPTDSSLPIQTIYIKTHDGTDWMSTFDAHPLAISGPAALQNIIGIYASQGIQTAAWFVPKGSDYDGQVYMAEQVIDSGVTALYADIEPFAGFCNQDCAALAQNFWTRLRQERPNARLGVIYDPRPWWRDVSGIETWFASANVAMPMCYWDTFAGQGVWGDPAGCVTQAKADLAPLTGGRTLEYLPLLQGDSTADRISQAMDAAVRSGAQRVSLWRRGVVAGDVWNMIRDYQAPSGPHCMDQLVDGCLVREVLQGTVYMIEGGAKFPFASMSDLQAMGFDSRDVQDLPLGEIGAVPDVPADGTVIQEYGSPTAYVVYGGARFPLASQGAPAAVGPTRAVPPGSAGQVPLLPRDYTRFREQSSADAFLVLRGARIQLNDEAEQALIESGYPDTPLYVVPDGGLTQVPVAEIKRGDVDCNGTVGMIDVLIFLRAGIGVGGPGVCAHIAGNVSCFGFGPAGNALVVLLFINDTPLQTTAACPNVGEPIPALLVAPTPTPGPAAAPSPEPTETPTPAPSPEPSETPAPTPPAATETIAATPSDVPMPSAAP